MYFALFGLGALLLLSRGLDDGTALLTSIAAGGAAGALALLALTVDETDEPFANVYSASVSLQNLLPDVPQRAFVVLVAAIVLLSVAPRLSARRRAASVSRD